ncbi:E3 ubiquitin-protein ligase SINA-like [Actinidia chinensis var. chinensis]|uniref:RING-type E3 ubiquitin transferase n=1 Tax=Actinidia chinensis var. chinensis TaxID=1590841 RepID=A0A2R6RYC2_ACTCC|nr:E3 ubiquitin-protein ligase SINA-like [Actinidia chinensis var. chinensis]
MIGQQREQEENQYQTMVDHEDDEEGQSDEQEEEGQSDSLVDEEESDQQEDEDEDEDEDEGEDEDEDGEASGDDSISETITLTDPDVFDCPVCFDTLTIPVFQCENGHVACSSCCIKLRNKCPSCSCPIGQNRCRAIEKVLESVKISCRNKKYGCREIVICSKKHDHEETCIYAPCSCPLPDCDYVASSRNLTLHFSSKHSNSSKRFYYNYRFPISLEIQQKYYILQEREGGIIFIINNGVEPLGNVINVSCIAPSSSKRRFSYELIAKNGDCSVKLESVTECVPRWVEHTPVKRFLLVPSEFFGSCGKLKLQLGIQEVH